MRSLVAMLAGAATLTGCGGSAGDQPAPAATAVADTRTVGTANGPVVVPSTPKRVVVLGDTELDAALSVGVRPIGTAAARGGTDVSRYLAERAGDPAIVSTARGANLEAVLEAEPDLIIATAQTDPPTYERLSAIAPTVVRSSRGFGDWKDATLAVGDALGRRRQAERVISGVEQRASSIRASAGERAGSASVIRWMPNGPIAMHPDLLAGRMLEATGHTSDAAAPVPADQPHSDPLSLENLGANETNWLYVATLDEDAGSALAAAERQPAYRRLGAVRRGRAIAVDGQVWSSANGPLAAGIILDDIERQLDGASS